MINSSLLATPLSIFYSPCTPLKFPSFPTRRASDLELERTAGARLARIQELQHENDQLREWASTRLPDRSEEHTSELQSRGHLVCRLLLENKKKLAKRSLSIRRGREISYTT